MLKIEGQNTNSDEVKNGWYLDRHDEPWVFSKDEPLIALTSMGMPYGEGVLNDMDEYASFTRLTGRIIISND